MSVKTEPHMCFWANLYGKNFDLPKIEDALQVKIEVGYELTINPPENLPGDSLYDEIAWLLNLMENNKEVLLESGVDFSKSQIWMIYYYDKQCNMEFDPVLMERMGNLGLKLCVSCQAI